MRNFCGFFKLVKNAIYTSIEMNEKGNESENKFASIVELFRTISCIVIFSNFCPTRIGLVRENFSFDALFASFKTTN